MEVKKLTAPPPEAASAPAASPAPADTKSSIASDQVRVQVAKGGPGVTVKLSEATTQADDLEGMSMLWQARTHRISQAHVQVTGKGEADVLVVGGTWTTGVAASDNTDVTIQMGHVEAPGATLIPGEIRLRAPAETRKGQAPAVAAGTVTIPLRSIPEGAAVAVTLNGFSLDTRPTHEEGATLGGLGVQLKNPRVEGQSLVFDYEAGIEAHATPDRSSQHLKQGFEADIRIGFTAWMVPGGAATPDAAVKQGKLPVTMKAGAVDMKTHDQAIQVGGQAGLPGGHLGLTGFKLQMGNDCPLGGRYLRGMAFDLEPGTYDPKTGSMSGKVTTGYTNTGEVSRATRYALEVDSVLIQSPQPITYEASEKQTTGMP